MAQKLIIITGASCCVAPAKCGEANKYVSFILKL